MRIAVPVAWFFRLLFVLCIASATQLGWAAAYATGGNGKYKNEILWLTWGSSTNPNGVAGVALKDGDISRATIGVVGGVNLEVVCRISSISRAVSSYAPGDWSGDTIDDAYNIGGIAKANRLVSGIMSRSGTSNFTVSCESSLDSAAGSRAINLRGFVIADAESMAQGTEHIIGAAKGKWSVIELMGSNNSPYLWTKENQLRRLS